MPLCSCGTSMFWFHASNVFIDLYRWVFFCLCLQLFKYGIYNSYPQHPPESQLDYVITVKTWGSSALVKTCTMLSPMTNQILIHAVPLFNNGTDNQMHNQLQDFAAHSGIIDIQTINWGSILLTRYHLLGEMWSPRNFISTTLIFQASILPELSKTICINSHVIKMVFKLKILNVRSKTCVEKSCRHDLFKAMLSYWGYQ